MLRYVVAVIAVALLASCGGGSDDGGNVEVPVALALEKAFGGPIQYELQGKDGLRLRIVRGPGDSTTIGAQRIRSHFGVSNMLTTRETLVLLQNGRVISTNSRDLHWTSNPLRLYGTSNSSNRCSFVTGWYPPPTLGAPADGGTLYVATTETPCSGSTLPLTYVGGTWYVQRANSGSAWVCVHILSDDECYRVTTDGHLIGAKVQTVMGNTTWIFD